MLRIKQEAVSINATVNGLTQLGIKPESTGLEARTFITRPFELLKHHKSRW